VLVEASANRQYHSSCGDEPAASLDARPPALYGLETADSVLITIPAAEGRSRAVDEGTHAFERVFAHLTPPSPVRRREREEWGGPRRRKDQIR
jgi:hypothetical protein